MLSETLKEMGVVGAGGAGFPTYVKAAATGVEILLANGAECEPLLHKDFELMCRYPAEVVSGMKLMMEATGAGEGKFGIKAKNRRAIEAIEPKAREQGIEMVMLGDFYPSGDEYELVHTATGRLIPPAGIPLAVGCVVNNVETLYNVDRAARGKPVTHKFVSLSGAVRQPKSLHAPIGTPIRDLIARAGGATVAEFGVFVSGIMMGRLSFDLDEVITKTTAGLIVLPKDHYLIGRMDRPRSAMNRIGKSACDQCTHCTEICPRYLLGYEVMPHKVMRGLGFTLSGDENWNLWAQLCCGCGLCTLYSCPEGLFPKEACDAAKLSLKSAGLQFTQEGEVRVHPMKEDRRVPLTELRRRLRIEEYETTTPFDEARWSPGVVRLLLSQHVGAPATPVVSKGSRVAVSDTVATVASDQLGADLHASISGTVTAVTSDSIEIRA